jgi:MYXO-CTERM domain-containing protein
MSKSLSQCLTRGLSAAAAACSLLMMAPASAAVIGSFDPAFGPGIPNLGFRGTITLQVSSGCFAAGPGFVVNDGSACSVTVDAAQINFYNSTLNTPNNFLTTINLPGSFFSPTFVSDIFLDATDQFAGLDSNFSDIFAVSVTDNSAAAIADSATISYSGNMLLFFSTGSGIDPAFLVNCPNSDGPGTGCGQTQQVSNPADITFTTVPEPDSVALAVLGMGALIASRRRRSLVVR